MATPRFSIKSLLTLTSVTSVLAALIGVWIRPDAPRGAIVVLGYGAGMTAFTLAWCGGVIPKPAGRRPGKLLAPCVVLFWGGVALARYGDFLPAEIRIACVFVFLSAMVVGGVAMASAIAESNAVDQSIE